MGDKTMVAPKKSFSKKVPEKKASSAKEPSYDRLLEELRLVNVKLAKINKKMHEVVTEHNRLVDFISKHFYLKNTLRVSSDDLELLQEKAEE